MQTDGFVAEYDTTDVLLKQVADWIMTAALTDMEVKTLLDGVCVRLVAAGVPLSRVQVSYRTLHPSFEAIAMVWNRNDEFKQLEFSHQTALTRAAWTESPFYWMIQNDIGTLRRHLAGPEALHDFPVLKEIAAAGHTDYLAIITRFTESHALTDPRNGIVTSWATDHEAGFSEGHLAAILRVKQRLAVAFKLAIRDQIARNVVSTYLGPGAGEKVLNGRIHRGDGEEMHAVIWYSDLRGSSSLAERLPPDRFLALLNEYFDCTAGVVLDAGGHVLTYIGDGVLAIFPIDEGDGEKAAETALAAAKQARECLQALNRKLEDAGDPTIAFGTALHVGNVVFGNIGSRNRLDFTAIGPAVNEVVRLESLTKIVGSAVLASGAFRALLPAGSTPLDPLGEHPLRGIARPIEVHALEVGKVA